MENEVLRKGIFTCFVAASDRFLRVHRQFCCKRWLEPCRCLPRACIPPEKTKGEKNNNPALSNVS